MAFFSKHLFFCTNQRPLGKPCCAQKDSFNLYKYAKERVRSAGRYASIKVSEASCLGQCLKGPILVIYPNANWYTYKTQNDLDEIINKDVFQNISVSELLIKKQISDS